MSLMMRQKALDACDGDLLDAIIYLERRGKIKPPPGGNFTPKPGDDRGKNKIEAATKRKHYQSCASF